MADFRGVIPEFIKHTDKVKKATRCLYENFGIDYFFYFNLDNSGNYSFLTNNPDIDEPIFIYLTQPKYSKLSDPVHQNTKC